MASANGSTECSGNGSTVPQWKRDLIQRRRQQNKVLTSNGASVKLCSAVTGTFGNNNGSTVDVGSTAEPVERFSSLVTNSGNANVIQEQQQCVGVGASCVATRTRTPDSISSCSEYSPSSCHSQQHQLPVTSLLSLRGAPQCGATVSHESLANSDGVVVAGPIESGSSIAVSSVVCNMRLETDTSSLCPSSEDAPNLNATRNNNHTTIIGVVERSGIMDFENYENEETMKNYANGGGVVGSVSVGVNNKRTNREQDSDQENRGRASRIIRRMDEKTQGVCLYPNEQTRNSRVDKVSIVDAKKLSGNGKTILGEECESDSSEELQYGPGIVNRLKSKYLNLTLREMNKTRGTVQRFRRAASLEDLLDCDDEQNDKAARKYAKRNSPGVAPKMDRYRNASRGNESMKRARSVETLMRYNTPAGSDEALQTNRLVGLRQEPVNDHIVLIDRTTVKIESRLTDPERPKAINKPKRIKPLLAETERPPPDLVKTTMRLFEGSVKKFKPKGEVAVKVATFKTINDTYKAQVMKKVVPKPPIQPKPFVNGNSKMPTSPKKIIATSKPTAEIIEKGDSLEEYRNDCVVTEPIVQSVSSVVSKFQQIEKSYTPTASPEPPYKLKFSPTPSPEPSLSTKLNRSNESLVKSPPVTPIPSPRISSPGVPTSPKRDLTRQNTSPVRPPPSPSKEAFVYVATPEVAKQPRNDEKEGNSTSLKLEDSRPIDEDSMEDVRDESKNSVDNESRAESTLPEVGKSDEVVDGTRIISKLALENISKAGSTMQYNFGDEPSIGKSYLPGLSHNGQKIEIAQTKNTTVDVSKTETKVSSPIPTDVSTCSSPMSLDSCDEHPIRNNDRFESEKLSDTRNHERTSSPGLTTTSEYTKPIGAISSLGLIKSSTNTNVGNATSCSSYPSTNEGKTIRSQKSDVSPPQKQIGIIRPLVSTKTQIPQQNLSNRELEKNLINRVKSIEQPTKVVVSLKSADEIQPVKKATGSPVGSAGSGGGGLWDTKPWNQANNTMVFNFSNRKDVPDYIENDGLIIRRKREKPKVGDGGVIVLDATIDASTTDDSDWEISGGPPSPCDVSFTNDNVLINGRSNLSKQPRNHKHRIQFDDTATRTFEYPSEASMLEDEGTSVDGDISSSSSSTSSSSGQQSSPGGNKSSSASSAATMSSALLGGGGLASFTPSKVDLTSEGFELGVTRTATPTALPSTTSEQQRPVDDNEEYLKFDEDVAAWGAEATADLLY